MSGDAMTATRRTGSGDAAKPDDSRPLLIGRASCSGLRLFLGCLSPAITCLCRFFFFLPLSLYPFVDFFLAIYSSPSTPPVMTLRLPSTLPRRFLSSATPSVRLGNSYLVCNGYQRSGLATAVPPVTQDATGSKGPTAMVFLNMGGPSVTEEVEDFLSRLFVCLACTLADVAHPCPMTDSFHQGRW